MVRILHTEIFHPITAVLLTKCLVAKIADLGVAKVIQDRPNISSVCADFKGLKANVQKLTPIDSVKQFDVL